MTRQSPSGESEGSCDQVQIAHGPHEDLGTYAGTLVLVATPIGNVGDISARACALLSEADVVCCEDTRHTGQLMKRLGIEPTRMLSLHAHNEVTRADEVIGRLREGEMIALVSDAGTPVISDPGERLVARVIDAGLPVTTAPGPSALVAAISIAGLPAARFCFEGFLPRVGADRRSRIQRIATSPVTSVLYESPLRVSKTLAELADACGDDRRVTVARELTKLHEHIWRGTLGDARARNEVERGEHVIVIAPAPAVEVDGAPDLSEALARLRGAGLSRRDVASALEILLGIPHRVAYQAAHAVEKDEK